MSTLLACALRATSCLLAFCVLAPVLTSAEMVSVEVDAGKHARHATPVSIELELDASITSAVVTSGRETAPAQIERLDGRKARVWWLVMLEAGAKKTYKLVASSAKPKAASSFAWSPSSGKHGTSMDLKVADRPVLRYMMTPFDRENIELTKKPFHHVFAPDGSRLITKGAGGKFPHHRGIYFGYSRCRVKGGGVYDTWHAHKGEHEVHRKVLRDIGGPVLGGHVVEIDWNDREGETFAREERRLVAYRQPDGSALVELSTVLRAVAGEVLLDGDRQHAGAQFRAAQDVAENEKKTRYLRPEGWKDLDPAKQYNDAKHVEMPWNAIQFPLDGKPYTVAYLSDPANPAPAEFSERLYGRFGEFFRWQLTKDTPLRARYRFWVDMDGETTRADVEEKYADLATPPRVTRK